MTVLGAKRDLLVMHDSPSRWERGAMAIYEFDDFRRGAVGVRRIQRLRMLRGDRVIDFDRDLGLASAFSCGPICVIGALDRSDTVGELQDEAEALREETKIAAFLAEKRENSTLIRDAITAEEATSEYLRRNPRTAPRLTRGV